MKANKIGREARQPIELIVRPALLDDRVLALDKSGPFTALAPDPARASGSACFDWMVDAVIPFRSIEQPIGIPIH